MNLEFVWFELKTSGKCIYGPSMEKVSKDVTLGTIGVVNHSELRV